MADAIKTQTILFVGIPEGDGLALGVILLDSNWKSHGAANCQEALEFLGQRHVPVVLAEADLPDGSWRELLNGMARLSAPPSLIVSSRLADNRLWAEVLNLGGYDVLVTPFETEEVLRVTYAARRHWGCRNAARAAGELRPGPSRTPDGPGDTAGFPLVS
jgi:DNA-binding response OmpR family regulator